MSQNFVTYSMLQDQKTKVHSLYKGPKSSLWIKAKILINSKSEATLNDIIYIFKKSEHLYDK